MEISRLILRNVLRHKLRSFLTAIGIAIAVTAFGFVRTVIGSWNAGANTFAQSRLFVRNAISIILTLPQSYRDKIQLIPGVSDVTHVTWYEGTYRQPSLETFFPKLAVDPENFFGVYSEFSVPREQLDAFRRERKSCIIGVETAKKFGLKIGDLVPLRGDLYTGRMEFVVRGFYAGKDETVDETQMFFQWKYLEEHLQQTDPERAGHAWWFAVKVENPAETAVVATAIDATFKNSRAETRTEEEKTFLQSIVSMSGAVLTAVNAISFVIIIVLLLVLANTMILSAREKITEYAVLKTLGFASGHLTALIVGESLFIAAAGGVIGLVLTSVLCNEFRSAFSSLFPIFEVSGQTIVLAMLISLLVGVGAAIFPTIQTVRMRIVEGLRQIG